MKNSRSFEFRTKKKKNCIILLVPFSYSLFDTGFYYFNHPQEIEKEKNSSVFEIILRLLNYVVFVGRLKIILYSLAVRKILPAPPSIVTNRGFFFFFVLV